MPAVLDASAVLALYLDEPGAETTESIVAGALLSSVNYTEVVSRAIDRGHSFDRVLMSLARMAFIVVAHDLPLARRAGELRLLTRRFGLSVGDRACLALAERERLPAYTTDRMWTNLNLGIDIRLVR
ncbi:MAG: type II toxin-antitoxin system VapC family toxin [Xanthobacteraceae bacterium]|nr:type II toxin-antitoxin system VapC family toxin [Xanthobacteraceae bacterium]